MHSMMKFFHFVALLHFGIVFGIDNSILEKAGIHKDPDEDLNVVQLITTKGYPVEEYRVQTEDGYILSLHRIPSGKKEQMSEKISSKNQVEKKKVVFLQHGLLASSADWVLNFPKQSLGFILADAGFDVWLGNNRGNTYSKNHIKYSSYSDEFWDFSFDEMAEYDLPAMIDFVLKATGQPNLYFIGHSQGSTMAFALLSTKPEYNEKIKLFIALAPVTTVGHITSAIRYLAPFAEDINFLLKLLGIDELLPSDELIKYLSDITCNTKKKYICEDIIFLFCGEDYSELNETRLGVYVSHTPAGTSARNIVHYAQMVKSKQFLKYDFGKKGNLARYKQPFPPQYVLENVKANVSLFWSDNDDLADPTDVHLLERRLKTLVSSTKVKKKEWNHLDFVWGVDAHSVIYKEVIALIKRVFF